MSGWIYAVYHEKAACSGDDSEQIKFGRSKHHPNRDTLDGRVRKLDLSVVALGFGPVKHAVEPFQVADHSKFERRLKDELKSMGKLVSPPAKRHLTEVCKMPLSEFVDLIDRLKEEFGI